MHAGFFELRDHTADIALYVCASTMPDLLLAAADGLYAAIGRLEPVDQSEAAVLELNAPDAIELLCVFLTELLFVFETEQKVFSELRIDELTETALRASSRKQSVDATRSQFDREVKAITRHDLSIHKTADGYETTIVLDI